MFKDSHSESLISLGELCYDGCTNILDKTRIRVVKGTHLVLPGKRSKMDGLWDNPITVPVPSSSTIQSFQSENAMIHKEYLKKPAQYLHTSWLGSNLTNFSNAIKTANCIGWSGLDSTTSLLHMQDPIATAKVHLEIKKDNPHEITL